MENLKKLNFDRIYWNINILLLLKYIILTSNSNIQHINLVQVSWNLWRNEVMRFLQNVNVLKVLKTEWLGIFGRYFFI